VRCSPPSGEIEGALASPSFSLSNREGAAHHIFNEHHNYHINFMSLFHSLEVTINIVLFEKRGLCVVLPPLGELEGALASPSFSLFSRERAAHHLFNEHLNYHINFISLPQSRGNNKYCTLRKARAVRCSPPLGELEGALASPSFSLYNREGAAPHIFNELHNYHISFISLFHSLDVTINIVLFEKRGLWWSRRIGGIGMGLYIGFALNKLSIDIGCGCITAPSLNLSRPV